MAATETKSDTELDYDDSGKYGKTARITPIRIYNPPGLSSIKYRVGTHGQFKASMYYDLISKPAFKDIVNSDDDLAVALIDSWATIADVLAFYQERIANEGFLRTANERRSILELSRMISRELGKGTAANASLAFTLDDVPGSVQKSIIDVGTKVQSIPGQGEMPQIYETVEKIEANSDWNSVRPKLTQTQPLTGSSKKFVFRGTATRLTTGDGLLIVVSDKNSGNVVDRIFKKITSVKIDPSSQSTHVEVIEQNSGLSAEEDMLLNDLDNTDYDFSVYAFRLQTSLFGYNAPIWNKKMLLQISDKTETEDVATETESDKFENNVTGDIYEVVDDHLKKNGKVVAEKLESSIDVFVDDKSGDQYEIEDAYKT